GAGRVRQARGAFSGGGVHARRDAHGRRERPLDGMEGGGRIRRRRGRRARSGGARGGARQRRRLARRRQRRAAPGRSGVHPGLSGPEMAARYQGAGPQGPVERGPPPGGGRGRRRTAGRVRAGAALAVDSAGGDVMPSFDLTSEQQQLKGFLHEFAKGVLRPISLEADRTGRMPEPFLQKVQVLAAAMPSAAGSGAIPEEYGGEEAKDKKKPRHAARTALVGAEELAWGDASMLLNL